MTKMPTTTTSSERGTPRLSHYPPVESPAVQGYAEPYTGGATATADGTTPAEPQPWEDFGYRPQYDSVETLASVTSNRAHVLDTR